MKLAMRRMASFNLKQTKKARGEGEEEEVFGPHIAPRIAHSLLHDKPAHVPAMYAAEGMDTGVRRPQAALMLRCCQRPLLTLCASDACPCPILG